jgi:ABC-type polysaccharide/polyol phosphate transport system ATPase subunit
MSDEVFNIESLCVDYKEDRIGLFNPTAKPNYIRALDDISLTIKEGQIVALIGKNGAGKSTLLRTLTGLVRPISGKITSKGRVILLAGTDPGFNMDSTGRMNILDLAKAYGIEKEDLEEFCESIIEFSGLGDDIDRNVRGYSTGMRGKLGFGFITGLKPDILLIDETLGVGDAEFRKRAQNRLIDFVNISKTVIISTHSFGLAKQLCNSGIVLDSGKLLFFGEIEESMAAYRKILKM